jgi:hypothetical protein
MFHEIMYAVLMAEQISVTLIIDVICELNFIHCPTSRKIAGSNADGVFGTFI